MDDARKTPNKAIIGIIAVVLLVIVATAVVVAGSGSASNTTAGTSSTSSSSNSSTNFKDGSYSATGNYDSPGGPQSIDVKVTLAGGVITDASVTQNATDREAEQYQSQFASGFKSVVIGKKISDISLSRVAGSSLTPIGFNSALDSIKSEAAA